MERSSTMRSGARPSAPAARSAKLQLRTPSRSGRSARKPTTAFTSPLAGIGKMRARKQPRPKNSSRPGSRRLRTMLSYTPRASSASSTSPAVGTPLIVMVKPSATAPLGSGRTQVASASPPPSLRQVCSRLVEATPSTTATRTFIWVMRTAPGSGRICPCGWKERLERKRTTAAENACDMAKLLAFTENGESATVLGKKRAGSARRAQLRIDRPTSGIELDGELVLVGAVDGDAPGAAELEIHHAAVGAEGPGELHGLFLAANRSCKQ